MCHRWSASLETTLFPLLMWRNSLGWSKSSKTFPPLGCDVARKPSLQLHSSLSLCDGISWVGHYQAKPSLLLDVSELLSLHSKLHSSLSLCDGNFGSVIIEQNLPSYTRVSSLCGFTQLSSSRTLSVGKLGSVIIKRNLPSYTRVSWLLPSHITLFLPHVICGKPWVGQSLANPSLLHWCVLTPCLHTWNLLSSKFILNGENLHKVFKSLNWS